MRHLRVTSTLPLLLTLFPPFVIVNISAIFVDERSGPNLAAKKDSSKSISDFTQATLLGAGGAFPSFSQNLELRSEYIDVNAFFLRPTRTSTATRTPVAASAPAPVNEGQHESDSASSVNFSASNGTLNDLAVHEMSAVGSTEGSLPTFETTTTTIASFISATIEAPMAEVAETSVPLETPWTSVVEMKNVTTNVFSMAQTIRLEVSTPVGANNITIVAPTTTGATTMVTTTTTEAPTAASNISNGDRLGTSMVSSNDGGSSGPIISQIPVSIDGNGGTSNGAKRILRNEPKAALESLEADTDLQTSSISQTDDGTDPTPVEDELSLIPKSPGRPSWRPAVNRKKGGMAVENFSAESNGASMAVEKNGEVLVDELAALLAQAEVGKENKDLSVVKLDSQLTTTGASEARNDIERAELILSNTEPTLGSIGTGETGTKFGTDDSKSEVVSKNMENHSVATELNPYASLDSGEQMKEETFEPLDGSHTSPRLEAGVKATPEVNGGLIDSEGMTGSLPSLFSSNRGTQESTVATRLLTPSSENSIGDNTSGSSGFLSDDTVQNSPEPSEDLILDSPDPVDTAGSRSAIFSSGSVLETPNATDDEVFNSSDSASPFVSLSTFFLLHSSVQVTPDARVDPKSMSSDFRGIFDEFSSVFLSGTPLGPEEQSAPLTTEPSEFAFLTDTPSLYFEEVSSEPEESSERSRPTPQNEEGSIVIGGEGVENPLEPFGGSTSGLGFGKGQGEKPEASAPVELPEEASEYPHTSEEHEIVASTTPEVLSAVFIVKHPMQFSAKTLADEIRDISDEFVSPGMWTIDSVISHSKFSKYSWAIGHQIDELETNTFEVLFSTYCLLKTGCGEKVSSLLKFVRSASMDKALATRDYGYVFVYVKGDPILDRSGVFAQKHPSSLSIGVIAGITVGGIALVSLLVLGVVFMVRGNGARKDDYDAECGSDGVDSAYGQKQDPSQMLEERSSFTISQFGGSPRHTFTMNPWLNESGGRPGAREISSNSVEMTIDSAITEEVETVNLANYRFVETKSSSSGSDLQ